MIAPTNRIALTLSGVTKIYPVAIALAGVDPFFRGRQADCPCSHKERQRRDAIFVPGKIATADDLIPMAQTVQPSHALHLGKCRTRQICDPRDRLWTSL